MARLPHASALEASVQAGMNGGRPNHVTALDAGNALGVFCGQWSRASEFWRSAASRAVRNIFNIVLVLPLLCLCGCQPIIKKEDQVRQKIVYLKKANDDLVSFCKCGDGHITYPPQIGCPWCGCGWLFTCIECRKAFTFAQGVEIESSWEELARRDITNRHYKPLTDAEVAHWIDTMRRLLADVRPGKLYVCIDGRVFERGARNVEFAGWYARHYFEQMPHVAALSDAAVKTNLLRSEAYWRSHALKKFQDGGA